MDAEAKRRVKRWVLWLALVVVIAIVLLYAVVLIGGHWWAAHDTCGGNCPN